MSFQDAQQKVDQWISLYGVRYFSELTNLALLTEEMGEFARLMAREYGEQSFKEGETKETVKKQIADEMADMLFVIFCLANQMGIDLDNAFEANMQKKTSRDAERHKQNPKLTGDREER